MGRRPGGNNYKRAGVRIAERRMRVAELYLSGRKPRDIAIELGVAKNTIYKDIEGCKEEWRARAGARIGEWAAELIARYELCFEESMAEWKRSMAERVVVTREGTATDKAPKITVRRENQTGNPALMEKCLTILAAIREMLGTDAPKRLLTADVTATMTRMEEWTDEQLLAIAAQAAPSGSGDPEAARSPAELDGVHDVYYAALSDVVASSSSGQ